MKMAWTVKFHSNLRPFQLSGFETFLQSYVTLNDLCSQTACFEKFASL